MNKNHRRLISLIIFGFSLFLVASCGDSTTNSSSFPSALLPPIESTPVGTVEASGFWVNITNKSYFNYVNKLNEWDTDCFVDINTTTKEFVTCMIDIPEGDLYNNDIELQYNAPPGLCDHVRVTPAWHWNYSSGYGPKAVTFALDTSGDEPVLSDFDPSTTGCTATLQDNSQVACSAAVEMNGFSSGFIPNCVYNYSGSTLPNCCLGSYTYTKLIDSDGDNAQDSVEVEERPWGGDDDIKACLGGSIRTGGWDKFTTKGYPVSSIQKVEAEGLNNSIKLPSNGGSIASSFSYVANYYQTTGSPHSHDGYVSATVSTRPYAVQPIDDLDGSPMFSGSEAYEIACLDAAFEVRHKIITYVREWNTLADFLTYETSLGTVSVPDIVGEEGVNCDYDAAVGLGEACNDHRDFFDILTDAGSSYITNSVAPGAATTRESYFPRVEY